ncbi:MAG: hypothetical protein WA864_06615 [Acetobacteraceae bacterium]
MKVAVDARMVKINPARRLYERLGFRTAHEHQRTSYAARAGSDAHLT